MFGLVERGQKGRCYIVIVPDRTAATLLKVICELVKSGTTIIHDSWSSYNKIDKVKSFKSMSVNHKFNFKDPETGAHTNKIEGLWSQLKRKFKSMNRAYLQSYINEFMWRQWNDVNRLEGYDKILEEIGKYYPPENLKLLDLN